MRNFPITAKRENNIKKPTPRSSRHARLLPVPSFLLILLCSALFSPALAEEGKVEELERRIAELESRDHHKRIEELESLVKELIENNHRILEARNAELETASEEVAAARAQAEQARRKLDEIAERVEPAIAIAEQQEARPNFTFGGYVKTDFMATDFDDGELPGDSVGRDFLVPSTIPIGGQGEGVKLDAHVRESRFHFQTDHTIGDGHEITSFIQLDFLTTPFGNERVSNSFSPRLRHAFFTYNDLLIGQTWNTFMDVPALAESVTFLGASGSTSFGRQPQIRYSPGNFAIALENSETTVTPVDGGRIETDDNNVPDLNVRHTWDSEWGHLQVAGILRQLKYEDRNIDIDDSTLGWGVSFSGKVLLGRDDLRWILHYGDGIGRYVGLNFANDAAIRPDGTLEAIGTAGGFAAYRHWWNRKWRSNVILSYLEVDNPGQFDGLRVNRSNWSGQVNLLYSPVPPMSFGLEYLVAEREVETRETGQMNQLHFMAKYIF